MGDLGPPTASQPSTRATLPSKNPTQSFWQTSHPNALVHHRSTLNLPETIDIVIIGSGITSVFAAWEFLKLSNKLNVLVVEARTTCSGATGRNGGHLMPLLHAQAGHIMEFELVVFDLVRGLIEEDDVPCDFRGLVGCLGFWNRRYFEEAKEGLAHGDGDEDGKGHGEHQWLVEVIEDEEKLRELRLKGAVGALAQNTAASLSPYKLVVWMWRRLIEKYGARVNLQTETPVLSLGETVSGSGRVSVQTSRGTVSARNVLVATNGYASYLLPEFDGIITPTQGQMSASVPHGVYSKQLIPHSYGFEGIGNQDRVMSDYLVQAPLASGGHLMFGGGRAFVPQGGVGVSDDSYVDVDAEVYLKTLPERLDLSSRTSTSEWIESGREKLDMVSSWTGIMGYSKDSFPWVGSVPDREAVWLCAGYTGHGMTNAPGCGRYIAQQIVATLEGDDDGQTEGRQTIPPEYLLSKSRLETAKRKPVH